MRNRRRKQEQPELNITAFLNLMVVLIPFLLLNAVFTQLSVIELNLPKSGSSSQTPLEDKDLPPIDLRVLLLENKVVLHDKISSQDLKELKLTADGFDSQELHETLKTIKAQPNVGNDIKSIRILASQNTPYDFVVQTMDAVRYYETDINGQMIKQELFPKIGLGNVPKDQDKERI